MKTDTSVRFTVGFTNLAEVDASDGEWWQKPAVYTPLWAVILFSLASIRTN